LIAADGGNPLQALLTCSAARLKIQVKRRHLDDHGACLRSEGAAWQRKGGDLFMNLLGTF